MTRTATEQRHHRTWSGPGRTTTIVNRALLLEVAAERARRKMAATLELMEPLYDERGRS